MRRPIRSRARPEPPTAARAGERFARIGILIAAVSAIGACASETCRPDPQPAPQPEAPSIPPVGRDGAYPTLAPLMRRVTPAVVTIAVESRASDGRHDFLQDPELRRFLERIGVEPPDFDPTEPSQSMGSGVIIDARRGYVMTNNHLLRDASRIIVTLKSQRTYRARKIAADPSTDVAILKIPPVDVRPLRLGDSSRLEVGDFVLAIGNPFGLGQTVTMGIVSAVGRSGVAGSHLGELIQTDASINPGNSGGPLISLSGEVVGINTALIGPTGGNVGIGFAVPSNRARNVLRRIDRPR